MRSPRGHLHAALVVLASLHLLVHAQIFFSKDWKAGKRSGDVVIGGTEAQSPPMGYMLLPVNKRVSFHPKVDGVLDDAVDGSLDGTVDGSSGGRRLSPWAYKWLKDQAFYHWKRPDRLAALDQGGQ